MYTLNKNNSLLLPNFDTSAIVASDVTNIILSLYILNIASDAIDKEIQFTVNPINLETKEKANGISIFRVLQEEGYLDISLPKELFEKMLGTNERFLLKLVDTETTISFAGVNSATTDPRLTIETTEVEEPRVPTDLLMSGNINLENITESQITINIGNNTNDNKSGLPWWLIYVLFPLIVLVGGGYILRLLGWV